jgi:mono/diheme cytochrome c family protein
MHNYARPFPERTQRLNVRRAFASVRHRISKTLLVAAGIFLVQGSTSSFAADAVQGKIVAERWCAGCHIVEHEQKSATTDQAPPFASIAKTSDFGANRLALLLLKPHPNMPKLTLSRAEVADLAEYILTLK